jgi:hypothetical protein
VRSLSDNRCDKKFLSVPMRNHKFRSSHQFGFNSPCIYVRDHKVVAVTWTPRSQAKAAVTLSAAIFIATLTARAHCRADHHHARRGLIAAGRLVRRGSGCRRPHHRHDNARVHRGPGSFLVFVSTAPLADVAMSSPAVWARRRRRRSLSRCQHPLSSSR